MTDLMLQGVQLMVLGIVVVFIFLGVLVFAIHGMSALARTIDGFSQTDISATDGESDSQIISAVAGAVQRYRQEQHKAR